MVVEGNRFMDIDYVVGGSTGYPISIYGELYPIVNLRISNNLFNKWDQIAIGSQDVAVSKSTNIVISGNTFVTRTTAGVGSAIYMMGHSMFIENNQFINSTWRGVGIRSTSTDVGITGNRMTGSSPDYGLYVFPNVTNLFQRNNTWLGNYALWFDASWTNGKSGYYTGAGAPTEVYDVTNTMAIGSIWQRSNPTDASTVIYVKHGTTWTAK
jgi:hypothetical protein